MTSGRSLRIGEAVFGGGVLALGLVIIFDTMRGTGPGNAVVGPTLFPYMIAAGLLLIGASLLREAFTGHIAHEGGLELDAIAVALASTGLIAQMLLLESLGWIPSSTLLFMAVARAFGSRRLLLDLAIGIVLAGLTFVVFSHGLDLTLPGGVIGDLIAPGGQSAE